MPDGKRNSKIDPDGLLAFDVNSLRAIGVSRPTLSRYFQDADRVSRSSRQRIEAGLEQVEYVPNFFATRMNRKSKGMIGVIIPYLNDLFFTKLMAGIERAVASAQ